ncbi:hypothetical protein ACJMK2_021062 [Sinanodonta woodiana]|uniref:ETS domain-containing protein n=1 Tax=Sinanodonta woodiana TaxID=1069815 RepID=A0ABD3U141_SINWO
MLSSIQANPNVFHNIKLFFEDIENHCIISADSMERNRTDDIQTYFNEECLINEQHEEIVFNIGGFMYPVDLNVDFNIGDRCDFPELQRAQYSQVPAGDIPAKECGDLSCVKNGIQAGQRINDVLTPLPQYSTPCTSSISNVSTQVRHIDQCTSAYDDSYFRPNPLICSCSRSGKQRIRGCRLWEFLRNLLRDPRFNPSYICWENEAERQFRIVKSKELATLWGSKKGNAKMTYEKLSRAMRYYYKRKVLAPVIGKRLVYSFGPRADLTPC